MTARYLDGVYAVWTAKAPAGCSDAEARVVGRQRPGYQEDKPIHICLALSDFDTELIYQTGPEPSEDQPHG